MIYVTCEFADKQPLSSILPGSALEIACECVARWGIHQQGNDNYVLAVEDIHGTDHILPKDEEIKWGRFKVLCIGGTV